MTNAELYKQFEQINLSSDNLFDKYVVLQKINKKYKTTPFFKTTKKSIYEAYELYYQHEGKIIDFISNLTDLDKIEPFLQQIMQIFDLDKYLNQLTPDNKELLMEMYKTIDK